MSISISKTGLEVLAYPVPNYFNRVTKTTVETLGKYTVTPFNRITKATLETLGSNNTPRFNRITKSTVETLISADEQFPYTGSTVIGADNYTYGLLNTPGYIANLLDGTQGANLQLWFKYETLPNVNTGDWIFHVSAGEIFGQNQYFLSNRPDRFGYNYVHYISSNYANPISGANNAMLFQCDNNSSSFINQYTTVNTGTIYTVSVWVKAGSGSSGQIVNLRADFLGGAATSVTLTNSWQRISVTGNATGSNQLYLFFSGNGGNLISGNQVFIYNIQIIDSNQPGIEQVNNINDNRISVPAFAARINPFSKNLTVTYNPSINDNLPEIDTGQTLVGDTWYHLSMNADYANKIYTTYLNGNAVNTYNYTGTAQTFSKGTIFNYPDYLGTNDREANIGSYTPTLRLIDFRFYNISKNSTSINTDINYHFISKNTSNLVSYLRLNGNFIGAIRDYKVQSNIGKYITYYPNIYPGATRSSDVPFNSAILNPSSKSYQFPYQISFFNQTNKNYSFRYNIARITTNSRTFQFPYKLGLKLSSMRLFQFKYTLYETGPTVDGFQFNYNLGRIANSSRTFSFPFDIAKYSGDIAFNYQFPYQNPYLANNVPHSFNLPFTIYEVSASNNGYYLPYSLSTLKRVNRTFAFKYTDNQMISTQRTFTFQYNYLQTQTVNRLFKFQYQIEELLLIEYFDSYNLQFVSDKVNTVQNSFNFPYTLNTFKTVNRTWQFRYTVDTSRTTFTYTFPFKTNVVTSTKTYAFFNRYIINRISNTTRNFYFRYRLDQSGYQNVTNSFLFRYTIQNKKLLQDNFVFQYRTEKYKTSTFNFSTPYMIRRQENEITGLIHFYEQ